MERRVSFFLRPSSAKTDRTEESGLGKDHQSAFAKTLFTSDTISVNRCYGPSAFFVSVRNNSTELKSFVAK